MWVASVALLLVFTTIASVDGFYFHLYKYRLWERPECRREHWLHTLNACLFPLTLAPLFLARTAGAWLWLALALNVATLVVESVDVFEERGSRSRMGGLTSTEYWMHFMMSGLRWGYVTLAFAAVPASAWLAPASWAWRLPASALDLLGAAPWGVTILGLPVAAFHVALGMKPAAMPAEAR
jgi:hypothetical protein